jgi:hypothetical protein
MRRALDIYDYATPIPSDFHKYDKYEGILFSLLVYRWSKWVKLVTLFKLRLMDNVIVVH